MAKNFYISDTHFNHAKIIKLANRPFKDVNEMNETMVRNWNSIVGKLDVVYHLGDFAWSSSKYFFDQLNGIKVLILGNHDPKETTELFGDRVDDYAEVWDGPYHIVLFHYPILEWNGMFKGWYHFYGHVHNSGPAKHQEVNWKARAFDIGAEALNYMPQTAEQIIMAGNT